MFKYWLPDENGSKKEYQTKSNAVVIIGANGAGKSKLGAWIEQQNFLEVHRIGAQRKLNFSENISLKSYEQAEDLVFFGTDSKDEWTREHKTHRWNSSNFTTKLMDDFENVLAALIALKNNENDSFVNDCKQAEQERREHPPIPNTTIDKLKEIWDEIFPQRKLNLKDAKFLALFNKEGQDIEYSASEMSDGERSVLYLTAQVLCVPKNKMLIIDEPEIHLHRSLMNRLWIALERCRPDCLFIYITHDTQFASLHIHADKLWIKEFDGQNWKIEKIEDNNLPEELLLDILGNRKNVLFVEGEKNSYDVRLYSALYPSYYVIPCGSCTQVIARTKIFGNNLTLHHCKVYGIIDRDFRSDYEIEKYKQDKIYTIDVAEVENLFLVEPLIRGMASHMGKEPDVVFEEVKKYVIQQRFREQINGQICLSVVAQIKYLLNSAEISKKNESEAKQTLENVLSSISFEDIKTEKRQKFMQVLDENDYAKVLKVFNEKNISNSVGRFFGIENKEYCQTIVGLLNTDTREMIIDAISSYLPVEIPR